MKMSTSINITASAANIWSAITNIENCQQMISAIDKIEIIAPAPEGAVANFVGLKWRETRTMFGKEAVETMWITDAETNVFYKTRAENHGAIYLSELRINPISATENELIMNFEGQAQSFFAKLMSAIMTPFFKGSMVKMLNKDLEDIKQFVESKQH